MQNNKQIFLLIFSIVFAFAIKPAKAAINPYISTCNDIPPLASSCYVTTNKNVGLYIGGIDCQGQTCIRIGESSDLSAKSWTNDTTPYPFTFSSVGIKTLYAEFKDPSDDKIYKFSQTFTIDTSAPNGYIDFDKYYVRDAVTIGATLYYYDYYNDSQTVPANPIRTGYVRFCDDNTFSGCGWYGITNSKDISFNLPPFDDYTMGEFDVYFQFKDKAGNITPILNDSIYIDAVYPKITPRYDESTGKINIWTDDYESHGGSGVSKIYYSTDYDYLSNFPEDKDKMYVISNPDSSISIMPTKLDLDYDKGNPTIGFIVVDNVGNISPPEYTWFDPDFKESTTSTPSPTVTGSKTPTVSADPEEEDAEEEEDIESEEDQDSEENMNIVATTSSAPQERENGEENTIETKDYSIYIAITSILLVSTITGFGFYLWKQKKMGISTEVEVKESKK